MKKRLQMMSQRSLRQNSPLDVVGWMQIEIFASILFLWHTVVMTTDKVNIKEVPVGSIVKLTICSESKEVIESTIEHYMKTYPYAGYLTWFSEIAYDPTHGFCVFGDRLASCD